MPRRRGAPPQRTRVAQKRPSGRSPGCAEADQDLFSLPPEELSELRQLPESLGDALNALESDREFLLAGGVFTDGLIDSYCALKREELALVMQHPNPMEFDLYFDL